MGAIEQAARIKALQEDKPKFTSGASSRSKARDYTLLGGPAAVNAIVDRHQFGLEAGHARGNWQTGKDDPDFMRDRVNHLMEHVLAMCTGFHPRDNRPASFQDVQAAVCNLNIILNNLENGGGLAQALPYLAPPAKGEGGIPSDRPSEPGTVPGT